jgi:hypothetical protein
LTPKNPSFFNPLQSIPPDHLQSILRSYPSPYTPSFQIVPYISSSTVLNSFHSFSSPEREREKERERKKERKKKKEIEIEIDKDKERYRKAE